MIPPPVIEAAAEIHRFLKKKRWRFCLIGGLVVTRWGEPRTTHDVDLSLLVELGNELRHIEALLEEFEPRLPDAALFAIHNRVLLLHASNGTPIDIGLAAFPNEERIISRATRFKFAEGVTLTTISAEDLIVMKSIAGRPEDWIDVRGVIVVQGNKLDWPYVVASLEELAELAPIAEVVERLEQLREEVNRRHPDAPTIRKRRSIKKKRQEE